MRTLSIILVFFMVVGCYQGPPYAFRLMLPPKWPPTRAALYLPFWLWEGWSEDLVFEDFKECERARKHRAEIATELLKGPSERKKGDWELQRIVHARCVPLR